MYTSISRIINTVISLLERNRVQIDNLISQYIEGRQLQIFKGMRQSLAIQYFPSLEIEPVSSPNDWATTRARRPRYSLSMTLTTHTDNEELHVEYIGELADMLGRIMSSPENLQLTVEEESRWTPNGGLTSAVFIDSGVEDVTYNSFKEGTIRTAEFSWFCLIHEPYPDFKFQQGTSNQPTILIPKDLS